MTLKSSTFEETHVHQNTKNPPPEAFLAKFFDFLGFGKFLHIFLHGIGNFLDGSINEGSEFFEGRGEGEILQKFFIPKWGKCILKMLGMMWRVQKYSFHDLHDP